MDHPVTFITGVMCGAFAAGIGFSLLTTYIWDEYLRLLEVNKELRRQASNRHLASAATEADSQDEPAAATA
jgi:hypothetical protein